MASNIVVSFGTIANSEAAIANSVAPIEISEAAIANSEAPFHSAGALVLIGVVLVNAVTSILGNSVILLYK